MRSFRNPRYAPESLERKLNPSGVVGIPVTAEVYVPTATSPPAPPATPTDATPCQYSASVCSVPGDPEPVIPGVPPGGTGPAPPSGDGSPPQGPPSTPSGPAEPDRYYC